MSEVVANTRNTKDEQLALCGELERVVGVMLSQGEKEIFKDSRLDLMVEIAEYAIEGAQAPQKMRFKEYHQTNSTHIPGAKSYNRRCAIENVGNASDPEAMNYAFEVELEPNKGKFLQRVDDVNGISHEPINDLGVVEAAISEVWGLDGGLGGQSRLIPTPHSDPTLK